MSQQAKRQYAMVLWFHAAAPLEGSSHAFEAARLSDVQGVAPNILEEGLTCLRSFDSRIDPKNSGLLKAYVPTAEYPRRAADVFLEATWHKDVQVVVDKRLRPRWDSSKTSVQTGKMFNQLLRRIHRERRAPAPWTLWRTPEPPTMCSILSQIPELRYLTGRWQVAVRDHVEAQAELVNQGRYPGYQSGDSYSLLFSVPHGIPFEMIAGTSVCEELANPFGAFAHIYALDTEGAELVETKKIPNTLDDTMGTVIHDENL